MSFKDIHVNDVSDCPIHGAMSSTQWVVPHRGRQKGLTALLSLLKTIWMDNVNLQLLFDRLDVMYLVFPTEQKTKFLLL